MINKGWYGGLQPEISPKFLLTIPVPLQLQSFQLEIEKIVKQAHEKQNQSKALYQEAEHPLLALLDMTNIDTTAIPTPPVPTKPTYAIFTTTKKEIDESSKI